MKSNIKISALSCKQHIQRDPLPANFNSLEEFWLFWDTHSTADYEDFMEAVDVQMDLSTNKSYHSMAKNLNELKFK